MIKRPIVKLECLGQYEKPIIIYKFRSMYPGADKDFSDIANKNGMDNFGKVINDPRITPFGRFMRRYFIDELPQFYDLKRGVISLVGIRPKSKEYWKMYPQEHLKRALNYKPKLFGVPYYYTNLWDFKDCIQAEEEYLDRKEREDNFKLDREYLRMIITNMIFRGLRSR